MALNMLRLDAKRDEFWRFRPLFLLGGHFHKIGITALPLRLQPRRVEKFRECRLSDVGEGEFGDKKETCARHKIAPFAELAI